MTDDELAAIMDRRWKARAVESRSGAALSDFVFHRRGRAIPAVTFGKFWRAACIRAELGQRLEGTGEYAVKLFHDLRRTAARNLTRAGVTEQVAMRITGHKTASMFRRYNIVTTNDLREALRLERAHTAEKKESNVVSLPPRKR